MTENKKYYYIVFSKDGDPIEIHNTKILDRNPVDFVIEMKNNVTILYSVEITKEHSIKFNDMIQENKNVSN